jgi:hypothetical protein
VGGFMSDLETQMYQCPGCGREYPWRPESAGRTMHCSCGAVLVIPFSPGPAQRTDHFTRPHVAPVAVAHEPVAEIGLADAPVPVDEFSCPRCQSPMRPGAVVCTHCGFRRRRPKQRVLRRRSEIDAAADLPPEIPTPAAASAASPRRQLPPFEAMGLSTLWDLVVPGILAVVGLVLEVILLAHAFVPPSWIDALACTPFLVLLAAGTVGMVFLSELLLLPIFDLTLGPLQPLVPKLAAAVLFPAAVGATIEVAFQNNATGIACGWLASAVLYLLLFRLLFDFDWPDAMVLIACVCLAHAAVLFLVLWPLTHGPMPLTGLWTSVFGPIIFQSLATFTLTGALIVPHFRTS